MNTPAGGEADEGKDTPGITGRGGKEDAPDAPGNAGIGGRALPFAYGEPAGGLAGAAGPATRRS